MVPLVALKHSISLTNDIRLLQADYLVSTLVTLDFHEAGKAYETPAELALSFIKQSLYLCQRNLFRLSNFTIVVQPLKLSDVHNPCFNCQRPLADKQRFHCCIVLSDLCRGFDYVIIAFYSHDQIEAPRRIMSA
jgi:hypothetical protein